MTAYLVVAVTVEGDSGEPSPGFEVIHIVEGVEIPAALRAVFEPVAVYPDEASAMRRCRREAEGASADAGGVVRLASSTLYEGRPLTVREFHELIAE